jgi:mannose-1-phosphate guanylyltransferase
MPASSRRVRFRTELTLPRNFPGFYDRRMTRTKSNLWPIVLAAGEGSRLRELTTHSDGTAVPKQFCSLFGERSLLEDAIARAAQLVPADRICTIVARQHRQWWSRNEGVRTLQSGNVFVQPCNRGTAIGVLYSLLHVLNKDSEAQVVFLPSDHYVDAPDTLTEALRVATERIRRNAEQIVLLGMQPEEADAELGYIVPGTVDPNGGWTVARFIEKPLPMQARELIERGALWNTFILAASARTLLHLFVTRFATIVVDMQLRLSRHLTSLHDDLTPLAELYEWLPNLDFSRDILEQQQARLCVLRVPACGWSDLGTPNRVGHMLSGMRPARFAVDEHSPADGLSLAHRYQRLGLPQTRIGSGGL